MPRHADRGQHPLARKGCWAFRVGPCPAFQPGTPPAPQHLRPALAPESPPRAFAHKPRERPLPEWGRRSRIRPFSARRKPPQKHAARRSPWKNDRQPCLPGTMAYRGRTETHGSPFVSRAHHAFRFCITLVKKSIYLFYNNYTKQRSKNETIRTHSPHIQRWQQPSIPLLREA